MTPNTQQNSRELAEKIWESLHDNVELNLFPEDHAIVIPILATELQSLLERVDFYKKACEKTEQEVQQIAGKALGYPWFKDDQKNFPGSIKTDGVCVGEHVAASIVQELANKYTTLLERVEKVEKERDDQRQEVQELSKDLCKMEDWLLGTKQTDGACDGGKRLKERIRDLIAKEGELGDLTSERDQLAKDKARLREKLQKELDEVITKHPTDHDDHDPYWRGVRIGLETSLALLKEME